MSRRVMSALVLCALAGPVAAQGLGDAARKERGRRSRAGDTAKVYTGDDLSGGPAPALPSEPATAASGARAAEPAAPAAPAQPDREHGPTIPDSSAARAREEARWRGRVEGLRQHVGILEREAEEADRAATMSAYGGPISCSGLVNTRHQRDLAEVQEARQALANARKALEDVEEEARRAGVPPGWLR